MIDVKPVRRRKLSAVRLCCFLFLLLGSGLSVYLTRFLKHAEARSVTTYTQTPLATKRPKSLKKSSGSYVHVDDGQGILVYASSSKFKTLGALQPGDRQAIAALLLWGEAFLVDNDTRVSVLVRGTDKAQVKITSGKYTGKTGWLAAEIVR